MKGFALVFVLLLAVGFLAVNATCAAAAVTAPEPASDAPLDCWNSSVDVSLQISIRNQGLEDVPQGSTIAYSYRLSARGALKNGSYKLDAPLRPGESRSFLVSPLQSWYPPVYQCTARVFRLRKSAAAKRRRS
jgi:hypothetical protein